MAEWQCKMLWCDGNIVTHHRVSPSILLWICGRHQATERNAYFPLLMSFLWCLFMATDHSIISYRSLYPPLSFSYLEGKGERERRKRRLFYTLPPVSRLLSVCFLSLSFVFSLSLSLLLFLFLTQIAERLFISQLPVIPLQSSKAIRLRKY